MSLKIFLLGQFKLQFNDSPIELRSRTAQSLLAYLVLNAGVIQRREKLANLLWPETTEANARGYLRQALWRIRKSLDSVSSWGDFLKINDISVSFDDQSDYWLDTDLLLETSKDQSLEKMIDAIRLYRGELLPGFYDEWTVRERDRLQIVYHQKMNILIECLIRACKWDEVLHWGEQWIRFGYSPEPAFRALMRAHAKLGNQGMVSATYSRCVEALNRELGLEPSLETQLLYEQLCRSELQGFVPPPTQAEDLTDQLPSFLDEGITHQIDKSTFVARDREIGQLEAYLDRTFSGDGQVVFIIGEAGSGKTALIQEFTRQAQEKHADLIIASGKCNAHFGLGDPYLPFREILEQLTGDVEAHWAAGAISREHARRLWNTLPLAVQALVESGPDLINTFIPGSNLVKRASVFAPGGEDWIVRLENHLAQMKPSSVFPGLRQSDLFEQYTKVMQMLARKVDLMIVVDDMQWADLGSISLLFHLGRHLAGRQILILGAYRPEEIALGRDGNRHPLEPVINELQREFGEIVVDMDRAERHGFVEALLDSEPNRLGIPFRQMIYRQTHGQPLFTIELLRGMQERGDLVQDQDGLWMEGTALDWETLPARVEAVIGERIGRLDQPLQDALRIASVEGEVFTSEIVARVQGMDDREMLEHLSDELDRKHRLIRAQSILRMDGQLLSSYRFQHILYQKYLYNNLNEVEKVHLHQQVGTALEELYGSTEEIAVVAPQLARHFQEARNTDKAIEYLRQAGERAVQLSAYDDGIAHLTKGLALLMTKPDSTERAEQELTMQLAIGKAWVGPKAYSEDLKSAFTRARELCHQLGKTHQLCQVIGQLSIFSFVNADFKKGIELGQEALSLAHQSRDPALIALGHWYLAFNRFFLGEYLTARTHLKHVIDFYKPEQHHRFLIGLRGSDAGISAYSYDACALWCLGYPDQALVRSQEVLALARELNHPFSLADALCFAGCLFNTMLRNWQILKDYSEELIQISHEIGFAGWGEAGISFRGEALAMLGQASYGIEQINEGIAAIKSISVLCHLTEMYRALAEAQVEAGQVDKGLATINEVLSLVEMRGEGHWKAEIYRLRSEFLILQGNYLEAETNLQKAIEVSQSQHAKSWELRAVTSWARLLQMQNRTEEPRQALAEIYHWFTEGFDTPDLIQAKALLEELS